MGAFAVRGEPDRAIDLLALARAARDPANLPDGMSPGLDTYVWNLLDLITFPNGCHIAEVEIDPETGGVTLERYTAVDDFGTLINPMLTIGQVQGGVAQGIGQAMLEHTVYDPDSGQMLSGSFMDYALPRAEDLPDFDITLTGVPTQCQSARRERLRPGRCDGGAAGDHRRGTRCAGATRCHAYRHAGDAGTGVAGYQEQQHMDSEPQARIAAEDYLDALAAHDIEHLFCNPGTDFAPIVEAFARAARTNRKVPRPMVVPHENAALSMAHGYTMVTGKPQAVMLHTNVGTANAINMLIDASRDRIPVLLTSGRTPFTESGAEGSRSVYIHWAQEMYDQAGMLREVVKWDYEMKRGDQAATVVDRALELAMASPKGPVYLSLPREVLGEVVTTPAESNFARRAGPRTPAPSPTDIEKLAELDRGGARADCDHRPARAGPA